MEKSHGGSLTSRLSRLYQTNAAFETIFLVMLGVIGATLLAYFRLPIKVPGHNGLIWITLLMAGRLVSQRRWAASISATSAAAVALLPVMGFKDPLDSITLLLPGVVIDLGFLISPRHLVSMFALSVLGASAHATKPIAKLIVSVGSGVPYPSLVSGILYPLSLHALFGAVGTLLAAITVKRVRPRS